MSEPLTDEQIRELLALEGVATLRQWDESWASRHMTLLPVDRRLAIAARNALPELLAEIVRLRAERDQWRQCVRWTIDEVLKHCNSGALGVCESRECGGCESDNTPPCEDLCRGLAHQLETDEANRTYDEIERLRAIVKRLLKTADGVPIFVGDVVWWRHAYAGVVEADVTGIAESGAVIRPRKARYPESVRSPDQLYSTPAAAKAVKDAGRGYC